MKIKTTISSLIVLALGTLTASNASATPRTLPFTYPYETLPEGSAEVEQFVDATWVRIPKTASPTERATTFGPSFTHFTEFEYGVTDRLELAMYLNWQQDASPTPSDTFEGTSFRARYRVGDEGQLPVDMAFYAEGSIFHDEYELEEKAILSKRFGNLHVAANLWVEESWERAKGEVEFVINPTIGATYQVTPTFHVGAEYWARGSFESEAPAGSVDEFNEQIHHFVGPALALTFGKLWLSAAVYARVDRLSRASEIGDAYGKIWVRTALGLEF